MTNYQESHDVVFDNEKNVYIVPKTIMDEIFRLIDETSPEDESDDSTEESQEAFSNPFRARSYCCEFTVIANGKPDEQKREYFKSLPGLAQVRCAAMALEYGQTSSYARRGRC